MKYGELIEACIDFLKNCDPHNDEFADAVGFNLNLL